ncbi:MAG: two-component regulator propeller domain-containing protein [Saprospiraceae bacterium]
MPCIHLSALLLSLSIFCSAQELLVNAQLFTVEDGLSDRSVFCMAQDNRGLVWVGTGNGLDRFDGEEFTPVSDENGRFSAGMITGIKMDGDGLLWIQKNREPVILFDPEKETILPLEKVGVAKDEKLELVYSGGQGSAFYFRNEEGRVFYLDPRHLIAPFGKIQLTSNGHVKPTSWNTLLTGSTGSQFMDELGMDGQVVRRFPIGKTYHDLYEPADNQLYFVIDSKQFLPPFLHDLLFSIEKEGPPTPIVLTRGGSPIRIADLQVTVPLYLRFIKDSQGRMWLVSNEKVWLFNKDGEFEQDLTQQLLSLSKSNWKANHLFIDRKDRLWISTGLGLFLIQLKENPFHHYLTQTDNPSIRGIIELPNDRILAGTYDGTKVFDKKSGEIIATAPGYALSFSNGGGDTIWGGMHGHSLLLYKKGDDSFHRLNSLTNTANVETKVPYYDPSTGALYIGTNNGLFFSVDKGLPCQPFPTLNAFGDLSHQDIFCFYAAGDSIWIASTNGLYLLDNKRGIAGHFLFPFNDIRHLHEDRTGIFWLATAGGGLIRWDRRQGATRQYTTREGLSHNVIYAVYEDATGHLWLPSNNGLMRFEKETGEVVVFQPEDGITHEEFNTYSHFQGADGRLYFGGLNGITAFYPEEVCAAENDAPFIVTQLQQFDSNKGKLVNKTKDFLDTKRILLKPGDKFFILDFSLLDFAARGHIYAWRIDGLDKEWNYQTDNSLRLNALDYGHFTLHIKAKGAGGQWAREELHLLIDVPKPFYLQWHFILTAIFLLILAAALLVWWRIRHLRREAQRLEKIIAERTEELRQKNAALEIANHNKDRFFAIIAHDLRSPLISLGGIVKKVSFLMQRNRVDEVQQLGQHIGQAVSQVHTLLDNLLNWALVQDDRFPNRPVIIDLPEALNEIVELYRNTAEAKNVGLHAGAPSGCQICCDRNALSTILRNLVDNAIKFTPPDGEVSISAFQEGGRTLIQVKDSGLGMSEGTLSNLFSLGGRNSSQGTAGEKGTGLGLVLVKDLLDLNNGTIEVLSQGGCGTTIRVGFPSLG